MKNDSTSFCEQRSVEFGQSQFIMQCNHTAGLQYDIVLVYTGGIQVHPSMCWTSNFIVFTVGNYEL